jgi:hypothetical protein
VGKAVGCFTDRHHRKHVFVRTEAIARIALNIGIRIQKPAEMKYAAKHMPPT